MARAAGPGLSGIEVSGVGPKASERELMREVVCRLYVLPWQLNGAAKILTGGVDKPYTARCSRRGAFHVGYTQISRQRPRGAAPQHAVSQARGIGREPHPCDG